MKVSKEEIQRRREIWRNYYNTNEEIFSWVLNHRIASAATEYSLSEGFSRIMGVKALMRHTSADTIATIQMPLYDHYDMVYDDERYEGKFRTNDSDQYGTDDISFKKTEYDCIDKVLVSHWDGVVYCYNKEDHLPDVEVWTHSATTAECTKIITEYKVKYPFDKAIWTTTITLPDAFK